VRWRKIETKNSMRNKLELALNRRALSPIFATLIILAVVTILFIPVFIWATGTTSGTQESWELSGLIATERIVIEEVSLKENDAKIYVRNIGKTAVTINDVLIQLSDGSGIVHVYQGSDLTTDADSVIQGDLITITIASLGWTPISSQAYMVKVFTTRGVGDTYQVVT
jgi:flagellin-like protein